MTKDYGLNPHGIVLLNKPLGITSNKALQQIKRLYLAKKAGHTGSLDPLATGMLPICLGEATKFSQYVLDSDKTYVATGLLGTKTTTGDAAGDVVTQVTHVEISPAQLIEVLCEFQGETLQVPSMFSALKHQGVPLYKYARQGIEIQREARPILVHELQLLAFDGQQFQIRVTCGKGTYIRNLVEDIGDRLGVGAHVTQLHREHTTAYANAVMYSMDELVSMDYEQLLQCLLPMDTPVANFPELLLSMSEKQALCQGKLLNKISGPLGTTVRLYEQETGFFGLGTWVSDNVLGAKRLLSTHV